MSANTSIFMIAGEASGDVLGASLMRGLKKANPELQFIGVGGHLMEEQGFESMIPMREITAIGIFEVALRFSQLLKRIQNMVEEIEARQPAVFVSIDLPDFNFQVAKRLKKRGIFKGKILHYVAPTVWAWRPGRAKKISAFVDGVMCLFPFETEYFTVHGMDAVYVGHPIIEDSQVDNREQDRALFDLKEDDFVLGVYFGSRESELKRHGPVFKEVIKFMHLQYPNLLVMAPTTPALEYHVYKELEDMSCPYLVVSEPSRKWQAMGACDIALAVSGTVGLELAYAKIPHVIAYKMQLLTYLLLKRLLTIKHVHLGSIILKRPIVPEFLQDKCAAVPIAKGLLKLLKSEDVMQTQQADFDALRAALNEGVSSPSQDAAQFVLKYINQ